MNEHIASAAPAVVYNTHCCTRGVDTDVHEDERVLGQPTLAADHIR
jgi:hypothetical protein